MLFAIFVFVGFCGAPQTPKTSAHFKYWGEGLLFLLNLPLSFSKPVFKTSLNK
jgi:hypothetical protein